MIREKDEDGDPKIRLQYLQIVFLDFFPRRDGMPGVIGWPHVSINTMERVKKPTAEGIKSLASRPIDNLRSARSESRLVCGYRRVDRTAAAPERAGGCAANAPPARACDLHADGGLKRRGQSDGVIAERCAAPHQVLDLVSNIHVSPRTWPSGLQPPKTTYVAFLTDPPSRTSVSVRVPQPRLRDRPSCHRRQARPLLATVAPGARLRTSLKP